MNPGLLGGSAGRVGQEVVRYLAALGDRAAVQITPEIRAEAPDGIPEGVARTVSENCRTLKLKDFGFDQGPDR